MLGGLIGFVPDNKLMLSKQPYQYPDKVNKLVEFLKFPDSKYTLKNKIMVFGTYNLRLPWTYSDIDTRANVIYNLPREEAIKQTIKDFLVILKRIENAGASFFTDAKAGIYPDGEAIHWTAKELKQGYRNGNIPDFNGHLGEKELFDAISDSPKIKNSNVLLKIDAVVQYYNKYLEITCVYEIGYIENGIVKGLNYSISNEKELYEHIINTLIEDTTKQYKKGKYFKTIKRIFALSRYYKDFKTARIIEPLYISNVGLLSSIESDLKTLELLIILNKNVNIVICSQELNLFKEKISNILDIDFDDKKIVDLLDVIYTSILKNDKSITLKALEEVIDYLHSICNREVVEFLKSVNITYFKQFGTKYIH